VERSTKSGGEAGSPSRQHQGRTAFTRSTLQKRFGAKRHIKGKDKSSEPDHAASCMSQALMTFIYRRCKSGLERSDIMKWTGEYIIDDAGQCRWHEGMRIQDEHMKSAYRKNSLIEFIIETSAVMGVKVGIA
jgi:hypothetical protein